MNKKVFERGGIKIRPFCYISCKTMRKKVYDKMPKKRVQGAMKFEKGWGTFFNGIIL